MQFLMIEGCKQILIVLHFCYVIFQLEGQVADYKKRLDTLRKAKNTTLIKREREVLEVGAPNLGQRR